MRTNSRILTGVVTGLVLFMLLFMTVSPGLSAPTVQVFDLGTDLPGYSCHSSLAIDINAAGLVAGYMECDDPNGLTIPVLWNNSGVAQTLGDGSLRGAASSVNDQGWVTGYIIPDPLDSSIYTGFLWKPGKPLITFTGPIPGHIAPAKVNNSGMVVGDTNWGFWWPPYPYDVTGPDHAFTWTEAAGLQLIPGLNNVASRALDVNDTGQVIIQSVNSGFLFNSLTKVLTPIPAGMWAGPNGMNGSGQAVGVGKDPVYGEYPFIWSIKDGIKDITTVLGAGANLVDIDNNGVIVGDYWAPDNYQHAFVWSPDIGFVDLGLPDNATNCYPIRSNNFGSIVGYCYVNGDQHGVLWKVALPLPNPAQQIAQLSATVSNLASSGILKPGAALVLTRTLDAAQTQLANGHNLAARVLLNSFILQVRALIAARQLNPAVGQELIDSAHAIIAQLR